jgi:pimeloyl-ACP methyl ester carboxylesterase
MRKYLLLCLCLSITLFAWSQNPSFTVQKSGKGKAVLLLPGFVTPGSVWQETVRQIPSKHQMHVFTYAGFGGTAPIDTPWYAAIKRDLLLYIKKEKLSHFIIIGHSMGGTLAMDIAATLPDKVDKIVLVDALPCMRDLMMPNVSADKILYNSPYNQQVLDMKAEAFQQMAAMMAGGMTAQEGQSRYHSAMDPNCRQKHLCIWVYRSAEAGPPSGAGSHSGKGHDHRGHVSYKRGGKGHNGKTVC